MPQLENATSFAEVCSASGALHRFVAIKRLSVDGAVLIWQWLLAASAAYWLIMNYLFFATARATAVDVAD